jgi:two-component system alkaline phosphatase synthesis response regulator PhoP
MKKTKILVVDDEQDIIEILRYNLEKEGFEVHQATNGREGMKVAESVRPDLVILDIMMPELDGVELCRMLRGKPEFKQTLITFLTAREEDYSQIAALEVGGDDYITKPIRPRVLVSRIKALLRRASRETQQIEDTQPAVFGELTINFERVGVEKAGQLIDLAKKEFELLSLLASRPGKVFSREEILKKIWGADIIVGNRTIDVHIRKIREKIGEEYIKTVKGIGYKFEF